MILPLPTNCIPFTLIIGFETKKPERLIIQAKDPRKPDTYYYRRKPLVNGYREFNLKFPVCPRILELSVINAKNVKNPKDLKNVKVVPIDNSFKLIKFEPNVLKTNPIELTDDDKSFIKFAEEFSERASTLSAGKTIPSIYRSDCGKFTIDFYDIIFDKKTKQYVSTPARVGHNSGIIEVSKDSFLKLDIPMRVAVLLHEYGHKFKNPLIGREISDEIAADINSLRIYLSLGYSEIEAFYVYNRIFREANSEINRKRYLILTDFITKFNKGEFNNIRTDYVKR